MSDRPGGGDPSMDVYEDFEIVVRCDSMLIRAEAGGKEYDMTGISEEYARIVWERIIRRELTWGILL